MHFLTMGLISFWYVISVLCDSKMNLIQNKYLSSCQRKNYKNESFVRCITLENNVEY